MRDTKEIIEDMRKNLRPFIAENYTSVKLPPGIGPVQFLVEFDHVLVLAAKGADLAASENRIKTVADVIDDLERQMMMTGADSIDLSYTFEHKPYVFGVRLTMLEHYTAEVKEDKEK